MFMVSEIDSIIDDIYSVDIADVSFLLGMEKIAMMKFAVGKMKGRMEKRLIDLKNANPDLHDEYNAAI